MSVAATASSPGSAVLVIPPINEMIDLGTALRVSTETHLPGLILILLVGAAILSGLLAGYSMAKRRQRSWFHVVAYAALLAITVYTVLDLDHPRFGLINMDACLPATDGIAQHHPLVLRPRHVAGKATVRGAFATTRANLLRARIS